MGPRFKKSLHKHLLIFLMLNINAFNVQGFTLRSCYISRNTAICTDSKLKEVPADIPPTVEGIDLSNNTIFKLQAANFTNFPIVTKLNLRHNRISKIGKGTFSRLFSLNTLILNNNKLEKLDNGIFEGLSNLTELLITSNGIRTVEPDAFRSLNNLNVLDFSGNKLRKIEQVALIIKHMPHLTDLRLQHNSIKAFKSSDLTNKSTEIRLLDISLNPMHLFQVTTNVFPNLTWLNVGNPPMKLTMTWDVPDKTMLAKVDTLDVSKLSMASSAKMWNLLSTFNTSLVTLKINAMHYNLKTLINKSCSIPTVSQLQLQKNNLFFIRTNFFEMCTNVTEIDLSQSGIKNIENDSFTAVSALRVLSLSRNKLQSVPYAVRNLPLLTTLELDNNLIQTLGCFDFVNLTNLQRLSLQWNKIAALSDCAFQNLPKLKTLELQGNSLTKINNAFHTSLPHLKTLRLNQNSLMGIKRGEFQGLSSLEKLFLFQNQISKLEKGCFAGLTNLSKLQLQNNNIKKETMDSIFKAFTDLVNLQSLDMGNNHIGYSVSTPLRHPPFSNLSKLENLSLNVQKHRGKSVLPSNFLQGLTNLSTLSLRNNQLVNITDDFFVHTPNLDSLDLNANDLMEISPYLFSPIPKITKLRISTTNLRSLDFLKDANLTKLEFLQARKNAFSVISKEIIKSMPRLSYIDLKFNSFICDCDNSAFVEWIRNDNQTQVFDAYDFKCYYPPHRQGTMLLDLDIQSCMIDIEFICFILTTSLTLLFLAVSLAYHFMRFQLAYAYYLFLAWLSDRRNESRQASCQYDAFVSYNVHDEAWVCKELVPHLEKEQGWKLCLHHRDFEPGRPIVDNITDAIYGSRKTLCVISKRYLQSEWCSREMQVASFRLFDESKDVLILVFLEDIPPWHLSPYYRMRRLLKRQSYLSWPGTGAGAHVFWEKLRQALTGTRSAAEERLLLTVTDEQ